MATATATAKRRSSKFVSYSTVKDFCDKPIAKRRELAIGRGGAKRRPRKFHSNVAQIDQLRAEWKEAGGVLKNLPNPYNLGSYHFIVAALCRLGVDERFRVATVAKKVRELMSDESTIKDGKTAWQRFEEKPSRNEQTGMDADGRLMQNVKVLQRTDPTTSFSPYGLKLLEVGTKVLKTKGVVIDVLKGPGGEVMLRLNTNSAKPINELKTRGVKVEGKTAKPRKAKAVKVEAAADAPAVAAPTPEVATEPVTVPVAEVTADAVTVAPVAEVAATPEAAPETKEDVAAL